MAVELPGGRGWKWLDAGGCCGRGSGSEVVAHTLVVAVEEAVGADGRSTWCPAPADAAAAVLGVADDASTASKSEAAEEEDEEEADENEEEEANDACDQLCTAPALDMTEWSVIGCPGAAAPALSLAIVGKISRRVEDAGLSG